MQFVILCQDKPESLELRMATRPAHLDYLKTQDAQLLGAGPLLDDNDSPIGSMFMVEFSSEAEAKNFSANDPYAKAGLFAKVEVRRWRWLVKPQTA
jgi:uncharacterized protein YciI